MGLPVKPVFVSPMAEQTASSDSSGNGGNVGMAFESCRVTNGRNERRRQPGAPALAEASVSRPKGVFPNRLGFQ